MLFKAVSFGRVAFFITLTQTETIVLNAMNSTKEQLNEEFHLATEVPTCEHILYPTPNRTSQ